MANVLFLGPSRIRQQWLPTDMAVRDVVAFEHRFGQKSFWLACHGAFPYFLTPELLNLIHLNFLEQYQIPPITEADFLLSPLCQSLADGLYRVEPSIREVLLVELEKQFGWRRPLDLAKFLASYLNAIADPRLKPEMLNVQKWIVRAYLDTDGLVKDLRSILKNSLPSEEDPSLDIPTQIQVATVIELADEPLESTNLRDGYVNLIKDCDALVKLSYDGGKIEHLDTNQLSPAVRHFLGEKGPPPGLDLVYLDIELAQKGKDKRGQYRFHGADLDSQGKLTFDPASINKLFDLFQSLNSEDYNFQWEAIYNIRDLLDIEFFKKNQHLLDEFYMVAQKLRQKIEIKFIVDEISSQIPLEFLPSINFQDSEYEFLMLQVPIYRSLRGFSFDKPLSKSSLNCLIIDGDLSKKPEADWLESYLLESRSSSKDFEINEIFKIGGREFINSFVDVLSSNTWDLVHYTGHLYDGFITALFDSSSSYDLSIRTFCEWLRIAQTRFLYLSCQISDLMMFNELIPHNIASVLYYKLPISEDISFQHVKQFYLSLIERESLPRALLHTRRNLFQQDRKSQGWAAAVLFNATYGKGPINFSGEKN